MLTAARAPKRETLAQIAAWLERQVREHDVDVRLNVRATASDVLALKPEAVIIATGATPRVPGIPGVALTHVTTAAGILAGNHVPGRRCVVVDEEGHCTTPTTADFLAQRGHQVTLISRYFMVGEDIDEGVRADLYARLFKQGVRVETTTVATEVVASASGYGTRTLEPRGCSRRTRSSWPLGARLRTVCITNSRGEFPT